VVVSIDQNPVFEQAQPDSAGNRWVFQLTLNEEAGVGTTLTDFTIDGVSHAAQIASWFGGTALPADGQLTAHLGLANVAVPKNVVFGFAGVDASGAAWTTQIAVPFSGPEVAITIAGISNTASGQQVYAPGMLMSIYGTNLGGFVQGAGTVPLPQYLAGFQALINGNIAPLFYVSPTQVNVQIPYETLPGTATLQIGNSYQNATAYRFQVAAAAPGIFVFADGSLLPANSGSRGQTLSLYLTGAGALTPAATTGSTPTSRAIPVPSQAVTVTVGGVPVTPVYIGVPSWSVGVVQINFTIPASVAVGPQPVVVTIGGAPSNAATFTVQ
jgi:uncharacterized protein (TIGR03437 family)